MNPQNSTSPSSSAEASGFGGDATETGGTLAETKNKITLAASDAASKVKEAVSTTAAKARDQAERLVCEKKETAADRIGQILGRKGSERRVVYPPRGGQNPKGRRLRA